MNLTTKFLLGAVALGLTASMAFAEPPEWSGDPDVALTIETVPGMMRYDLEELQVEPGARVKLTLDNVDDLQHNLVLLSVDPDDKDGQKFAQEAWLLGEDGIAMGWVPKDHPRVLAASALLDPEASEDLYFVAPEEPGSYPYVCSVPGHSMLMKGLLKVQAASPGLEELTYSIYQGDWQKLPDFSALDPVKTGTLPDGRIDLNVAKQYKGGVGIVFEGNLRIETEEDYRFYLASDDGSRLIIDGEGVIDLDGIHPMGNPTEARERLQEGVHSVRVAWFDGGGQRGLSLSVASKSLGNVSLSADGAKGKPKKASPPPMLLRPQNGEAITHRAFIPGVSPRAIAVGYPGGVNLCWDADLMNLALVWRGGFVDVAPHWNGRGSGSQPAGYDKVETGGGLPMQVLESLDEDWQTDSRATIKYERDTADPQKDITFDVRHPDYHFEGYSLDEKRFPTFRYTYCDVVKVSESFQPARIDGNEALVRTVTLEDHVPAGTHFRIAANGPLTVDGQGWHAIGAVAVKVEGAPSEPFVREAGGKKELLVALDPDRNATTLTITYRWTQEVGGRKD